MMNRNNRAGIQTETSVNGIQNAKPLPTCESIGRLQLSRIQQRRIVLRRIGCSLVVLLPLVAMAAFIWWDGVPVRRAEKLVTDSGPGIGATRGEVETWLGRQGIPHKRIERLKDSDGYPAERSPSEFDDLVPGVQEEYVVGKVNQSEFYPSQLKSLAGGEVWIYFFFDPNGRLIQFVIKKWNGWL